MKFNLFDLIICFYFILNIFYNFLFLDTQPLQWNHQVLCDRVLQALPNMPIAEAKEGISSTQAHHS